MGETPAGVLKKLKYFNIFGLSISFYTFLCHPALDLVAWLAGVLKLLNQLRHDIKEHMSSIFTFFREVRAEMAKVIWPSRGETIRYTVAIVIFSLVLAVILGAADLGLLQGLEAIINK